MSHSHTKCHCPDHSGSVTILAFKCEHLIPVHLFEHRFRGWIGRDSRHPPTPLKTPRSSTLDDPARKPASAGGRRPRAAPPPQPLARDHALPAAEPVLLDRLGLPSKQEHPFTWHSLNSPKFSRSLLVCTIGLSQIIIRFSPLSSRFSSLSRRIQDRSSAASVSRLSISNSSFASLINVRE